MQLRDILKGRILLVGVGNSLRGDDAAGTEFIRRCSIRKIPFELLDTGSSPENFIAKITNSDFETVILIDSVEMGEVPGTIKVFLPQEISELSVSTHNQSLKVFFEFIKLQKPGIKTYLIGIQPKSLNFGEKISPKVNKSIDKLIEELCMS